MSKSSVSRWVRDIELTPQQHEALRQRNPAYNGQRVAARNRAARARAVRAQYQEEGRRLARRGDAFHAAGCMLFWGEGSRAPNSVRFANSDPAMLRYFAAFLRTYFDVRDAQCRVWCNLFADHAGRQREIENFWLDVLALPRACLTKSTVNVYSKHSRRKRTNMLPYGTCRLIVHSTRVLHSIYGSIQEYGGFERPEWLR